MNHYTRPSPTAYRPVGLASATSLREALKRGITRAKFTSTGGGRQDKAHDIGRGRAFTFDTADAAIDQMIACGMTEEGALMISQEIAAAIIGRMPPRHVTLQELQRAETHTDGLVDEAQVEVAYNPTCPAAKARLAEHLVRYMHIAGQLLRSVTHVHEVSR